MFYVTNYSDELYHHGIKGMKWGVRRFQRKDGSLTNEGARRYANSKDAYRNAKSEYKQAKKAYSKSYDKAREQNAAKAKYKQAKSDYKDAKKAYRKGKVLTKMGQRAAMYQMNSLLWDAKADALSKQAATAGPMAYGRKFNKINQMRNNAKDMKRYADFGRKVTGAYMKKLSKNYTIVYDVTDGSYTLRPKRNNAEKVASPQRKQNPKTEKKSVKVASPQRKQNPKTEKKLVKDMIKNYDMSDPDSEEALAILREIEKDR